MFFPVFPLAAVFSDILLCLWEEHSVGTVSIGFALFPLSVIDGAILLPNLSPLSLEVTNVVWNHFS